MGKPRIEFKKSENDFLTFANLECGEFFLTNQETDATLWQKVKNPDGVIYCINAISGTGYAIAAHDKVYRADVEIKWSFAK